MIAERMVFQSIKKVFASVFITIMFALKRVDDDLRADPLDLFKVEQRMEIKSIYDRFDEKYVEQFYEILKKADKFIRSANPSKVQKTAGKFGLNYGMKDQHGRRFEHYGFFDEKHKHYGKSINEVRNLEITEKQLTDDDYPVIVMYQNKKEFSFNESAALIMDNDDGFFAPEIHELARMKKYPLIVTRKEKVANRIEQLTEFLHVKRITDEHFILECFIPNKFKLEDVPDDSPIFKELIDFQMLLFKDEYGDANWYSSIEYYKRGVYKKFTEKGNLNPNGYDIIKFKAKPVKDMSKP